MNTIWKIMLYLYRKCVEAGLTHENQEWMASKTGESK